MLLVTRWLQALTISYLIGVFEIMIMPIEMFGTITANKFNGSFILRIKNKGDLKIKRCHKKVMNIVISSERHFYAKYSLSSSFLLFVPSQNEVLYLATLHFV